MSFPFLRHIWLLLVFMLFFVPGYGQREVTDTMEAAKVTPTPKADEVFFSGVKAVMLDDSAMARQQFEQFVLLKPEVPDGYYELAKLNEIRNPAIATEDIKKAIALEKDNKWFKEEYAVILGGQGSYKDAAGIMAELSASEESDPNYPILAAEYYERAHAYAEAIVYIDKALTRNGPDEDLIMKKVQLYLNMNKVDEAAKAAEELIVQNPKNGKYYKELGDIYENNKMPGKALGVYERAQKIIPSDPAVQLGFAEHYLITGDTATYFIYVKQAITNKNLDAETQLDLMRAYIQSLPNNNDSILRALGTPLIRELMGQHLSDPMVLSYYGDFLEFNNKHDSAMLVFKHSLTLLPSNFNLWEKVLRNYSDAREADSLIKYSDKAARLFPTQALVYYYNSVGHYNKKDYPAAIKSMKRAIDLQPEGNPDLLSAMYSLLAEIYHQAKEYDQSDAAFEKALELQPDDAMTLNNYSYYLSERGKKLDLAERMSKRSLALRPDEATFLDTYGWILYQQGEYAKAKEYIQKAIDMAGAHADGALYDHLGNVFYKLKEKDKAIESWKTAREKGTDDPDIDKKISEGKLYE